MEMDCTVADCTVGGAACCDMHCLRDVKVHALGSGISLSMQQLDLQQDEEQKREKKSVVYFFDRCESPLADYRYHGLLFLMEGHYSESGDLAYAQSKSYLLNASYAIKPAQAIPLKFGFLRSTHCKRSSNSSLLTGPNSVTTKEVHSSLIGNRRSHSCWLVRSWGFQAALISLEVLMIRYPPCSISPQFGSQYFPKV